MSDRRRVVAPRTRPAAPPCLLPLEPRVLFASAPPLGPVPPRVLLDYSFDANNFFNTPAKRDLMQAAADAAVSLVSDALAPIDPNGTNHWTARFDDPSSGRERQATDLVIGANTLLVYVGGRALNSALGIGGPGGYGATGSTQWIDRVATRGQKNARGAGATDVGPWGGSIAFDLTPSAGWHFDRAALPPPGVNDFFSVAMHEMLHVLGFGTADSWYANVPGGQSAASGKFDGPAAVAEHDAAGGPVSLNADNSHWAEGTRDDGVETIMDPTITSGTRKFPTALDWAAIDDIGWELPVRVSGAAGDVTAAGGATQTISVTFTHYTRIDDAALSAAAITVTGPGGFSAPATFTGFVPAPASPVAPDAATGSYFTRTATFAVAAPGGAWDPADNGAYSVKLDSVIPDAFGNASPTGELATFAVRVEGPPGATLAPGDVAGFGGATHTFTVTYADDAAVDPATIDAADVTVTGPDGAALTVLSAAVAPGADPAGPYAVSYTVAAPGGAWDAADVGAYAVALNGGQVGDVLGNFALPAALGTFNLTLPTINFNATTKATYTDADGDVVTVTLKGPGSGRIVLRSGQPSDAARIELTGTTAASSLTITTAKGRGTGLGGVAVTGALKSIAAKGADLAGDLTVTSTVGKVQLRNATGGTLAAAGTGFSSSLEFAAVTDFSINAAAPIKSLKLGTWADTDATPDAITAPSLSSLSAAGDFAADVTVGSLGKAKVGGTLLGSTVRAADLIASLTVGAARDSRVFAGVRADLAAAAPTSPADFANPVAQLKAFAVKSKAAGAFANTTLSAPSLGKAALGAVVSANAGATFGVFADRLISTTGQTDAAGPFKFSKQDAPGEALRAGDFVVDLL